MSKPPRKYVPKKFKCHHEDIAKAFIKRGWTLKHTQYAGQVPYEWYLEWEYSSQAVYPENML